MVIKTKLIERLWGSRTNAVSLASIIFIVPFERYVEKNKIGEFSKEYQLSKYNKTLNHERIHARQQFELFIIGFTIWYFIELACRYIQSKTKSFDNYYRKISFEKEAYENSTNDNYLKHRKPYRFLKYL